MDMSLKELLYFMGTVLLLVMSPGPNTVLVMQSAGVNGKKFGFYNVAGIVTALYFHAILAALGLSIIVAQSAKLYMLIKYIGAGYIIYLGVTNLYSAYKQRNEYNISTLPNTEISYNKSTKNHLNSYTKGFITNIFNPSVSLFYLSIIPQFVHNHNNLFLGSLFIAFIHSLLSALWYSSLVFCVNRFQSYLESNSIKQRIKAVSGLFLVALGFKMTVESK